MTGLTSEKHSREMMPGSLVSKPVEGVSKVETWLDGTCDNVRVLGVSRSIVSCATWLLRRCSCQGLP